MSLGQMAIEAKQRSASELETTKLDAVLKIVGELI